QNPSPSARRKSASASNARRALSSDVGSGGRSERADASPSTGGGGVAPRRMPSAAEATRAARARYGFASAPGRRHSIRHRSGWSSERITRSAAERFSNPQLAFTGAKYPGTSRLYELIVGLRRSDAAGRWSRIPATAARS